MRLAGGPRKRSRLEFIADGLIALAGITIGVTVLPVTAEAQTPLPEGYCGHDRWLEFRRYGNLYRAYFVSSLYGENDLRHRHTYKVFKRKNGRWAFVGYETHRCF